MENIYTQLRDDVSAISIVNILNDGLCVFDRIFVLFYMKINNWKFVEYFIGLPGRT